MSHWLGRLTWEDVEGDGGVFHMSGAAKGIVLELMRPTTHHRGQTFYFWGIEDKYELASRLQALQK